ncbi:MAG: substrate-binding domain-containing protein [Candidatus Hydrogenedentota bacterium]
MLWGPIGTHILREVQTGIDQALAASGYHELRCNLVYDADPAERQARFLKKILDDDSVAGLLAAFVLISETEMKKFEARGKPVVLLDCEPAQHIRGSVNVDHAFIATEIVKAIAARGRKSIAYVGPASGEAWVWSQRHGSLALAVKEEGLEFEFEMDTNFESVGEGESTRRLLDRRGDIGAIVYASDLQALGGMRAIKERRRKIPDDIIVIGFDDSNASRSVMPALSTVRQPFMEMGSAAARMLLDVLGGNKSALRNIKLESKLILRDSYGATDIK